MLNAPKVPNELLYILLAVAGGISDYLSRFMKGENFVIGHFISRAFIGGFSGLMVGFVGQSYEWTGSLLFAAVGIAGYGGPAVLDILQARLFPSKEQPK